jgi:hypothetical protein
MAADSELPELYKRLATIEDDVDGGRYRPGPWESLLRTLRERPRAEREEIADAVARVSRKLHMRGGRRTIEVGSAITVELAATIAGAVLLIVAFATGSNLIAIVSASIWATTFQPLIKFACGRALGVRYDYAYLYGLEPRLKMDFGSYIAAPRAARITLHLSGTVGSPLAVWIVWLLLPPGMTLARNLCWYAMWVLIGINVVTLLFALAGIRRLGGFRMRDSSSGAAAAEMREAVGLRA